MLTQEGLEKMLLTSKETLTHDCGSLWVEWGSNTVVQIRRNCVMIRFSGDVA